MGVVMGVAMGVVMGVAMGVVTALGRVSSTLAWLPSLHGLLNIPNIPKMAGVFSDPFGPEEGEELR